MGLQYLKPGRKMVKFGDVVKNSNLVERDPAGNGIERVVGLEHLDPENLHIRRWNSAEDDTSFTRKFIPGQTLFGKRRAYQRKVAFAEFEGICSGDILTFEPKSKKVLLPELLPFICQSDAFFDYALGTSAGSLSPRTSWTALKDFEFLLPPVEEQKHIAEVLWAADEAVEKFNLTIMELRLVQDKFFWAQTEKAKNSTAGNLEKYCEFITDGDHNPPRRVPDGVPHVVVKHITENGINLDGCTYISTVDFEKVRKRYDPNAQDIILTCVGTIGRTCIVPNNFVFSADRSLVLIRCKSEKIRPTFAKMLLDSVKLQREFEVRSIGTAQKHLYLKEIRSIPVVVPLLSEQDRIIEKMNSISIVTSNIKAHFRHVRNLKKQVASHALKGDAHV